MTVQAHPNELPLADTPLGRTIATASTGIWNDSCAGDELVTRVTDALLSNPDERR